MSCNMKKILLVIIGIVIGCVSTGGYLIYTENNVSTQMIDEDILFLNKKIDNIDSEIKKYESGLYLSLIKSEKAVYKNIVSALEMKKLSTIHRINMNYNLKDIVGNIPTNTNNIDTDISYLNKKIEEAKSESNLYRPCLMKSLIDTKRAQLEFTLSGLERAKIAQKYNIPMLTTQNEQDKAVEPVDTYKENKEVDADAL